MTEAALTHPSPEDVRYELERLVVGDLLGPASGENEEIPGRERVRDRYILGALAPQGTIAIDRERADEEEAVEGDDAPGAGEADPAAGASSLFPSSAGFSCAVQKGVTSLRVAASWGRYDKVKIEGEEESRTAWRRSAAGGSADLHIRPGLIEPSLVPDSSHPDVVVRGRVTELDDRWLVSLFLVNDQPTPSQNRDAAWLFQAELALEAADGAAVFVARQSNEERYAPTDPELPQLDMLYRDEVEFAVGHGIAVHARRDPANPRRANRITTAAVPTYEVPRTEAPSGEQVPELAGLELDMKVLGESSDSELIDRLEPLVTGYGQWLDGRAARIAMDAGLKGYEAAAGDAVDEGRRTLDGLRAALDLLGSRADAREAFRFANHAMWQQRVHTDAARLRRTEAALSPDHAVAEVDIPSNRSWRPFQLAFVLLNVPSLVDPTHSDRTSPGLADLLFFPTGGGKTEAYLGLTAFTLAIRRLQGVVDGHDGSDGVAVIMRYTLRLLTAQQFQRAAALICACELIRREDPDRWGITPFRIGMWVGASVSPNRTEGAARALEDERGLGTGGRRHASPVQLVSCPWCGTDIDPAAHARSDRDRWRTLVFCGDSFGRCEFTARRSPDEGLPVVTVDEEIYRLLPSMIISTADKWALLPWRGELHLLFGRAERRCTRHGYRSPDLDHVGEHQEADRHARRGDLPPAETVTLERPLRPPDLIIQDELHLISGPLGTMVGLYETAIDRLASWTVDGTTVRPKLVASTATIRRAADQVWAVFWRKVRVFPPPVLDLDNSFFAVRRPTTEVAGRRYVGICARGIRLKSAEVRVFSSVLAAAQVLYEKYGSAVDPWMTLVGYFNALRELGGMRRLVDDEVASRLRQADVRGLAKRRIHEVRELTSRIGSMEIPEILDQLSVTHDPDRKDGPRPIDVVLATNMISVGVDVSRLGLMVAVGQPKATAEYIQATSRVGREIPGPGLVFTIYNWARPRDLSHYEAFEHYHATFYRHVEGLSVTPFAPRALDRALSAVIASLVRDGYPEWNPEAAAANVVVTDGRIRQEVEAILARAAGVTGNVELEDEILLQAKNRLDLWAKKQQRQGARLVYRQQKADAIPLLESPGGFDWQPWTAPMSMRDVEPSVNLIVRDEGASDDSGPTWQPGTGGSAPPTIDDDQEPADEPVGEAAS